MNGQWIHFLAEGELPDAGIVVCIDDMERVLIIRRSPIDKREGQWTLPGGHVDDVDRSIEAGAARELKEETGLTCSAQNLGFLGEPKEGKYYFYAQKWHGKVNVMIPNPKTDEIEHDAYKWAPINDIKELANTEIPIYLLEKALEISKNAK